ncbi:MAG: IPT/TIG domain-containing protein [Planctomycetes bacterium]|nr:IPT/TIG domain-containing protein [Planctomycetota bacterium]
MRPFTLRAGASLALLAAAGGLVSGCGGSGGGSRGSASVAPPITSGGGFTNVGPLQRARVYHTATLLHDGRILIVGGLVGPTAATNEVEVLDPATGTVTPASPMTTPRMQHGAVLLPTRKVLVVGGLSTRFGNALSTTELFDPVTGAWTAGPALSEGRAAPTVTAFDQGRKVMIAGGYGFSSGQPVVSRTADVYSGDSNTIAPTSGLMSTPRAGGEAYAQQNGQVLFASGYRSVGAALPAPSEVYDIANDLFIPVAMGVERAEASLAVINSSIHALGGADDAGASLASAELFDGQSWSTFGNLLRPRQAATVTPVGAQGLVIGGRDGQAVLGTVESFPSGVAAVSSLADPRYLHAAVAVSDRVYVIGGFTTNEDILASIECFSANPAAVPGGGAGAGTRVSGRATTGSALTLSPMSGPAGTQVEITGAGFSPVAAANIVRFNGVQAVVSSVDLSVPAAHKLRVLVPAGATTGVVTVEVAGVVQSGPVFTVGTGGPTGPAPRILLVLPNSAAPFIPVSITGQDFGSQPVVTFNGVPTINIVNLSTKSLPFIGSISELVVVVPPGATSGPLIVRNGTQQSNPFYFTVR